MSKRYPLYFLVLLIMPHVSCLKQESVAIQDQITLTNDEWSGIYFKNELEGYVVGGRNWYRGIGGRTADGGRSWQVDSLYDKQLLSIASGSVDFIVASGIELNVYEVTPTAFITHRKQHSGSFRIMRGLDLWDRDLIMGVHGNGIGSIERLSTRSDSTQTILEIDRELNTILCIDRAHWIAGGYGILLRTEDEGSTWDTLDVFGDQFLDCSMPSADAIYILGSGGSVWRSGDQGRHFEKRRKGGIIGGGPPFKAICFKNRDEGLIGGEDGLLLRTEDGGKEWIRMEGLPAFNIQDISFDGKKYWLCGSGGRILSLIL